MHESMIALLDLVADLIAADISREVNINGEGVREAPTPLSRSEDSTPVLETTGNCGPIPSLPMDTHRYSHTLPVQPQPDELQRQEEEHDERHRSGNPGTLR